MTACALLLSGCAGVPVLTSPANQTGGIQGAALKGKVHGGEQPITGAQVYLYAVNTTGYGGPGIAASSSNASVSLLKSPGYVTTDSNGNFSITGDYTCPAGAQVYIYSIGGNPGLTSGTDNTAAGLLAGLGSCSALSSSQFIWVNEVSTIATAYALAGFASDATHISSSSTALAATGVANAMGTITNLESLSTGAVLYEYPDPPWDTINTLANILAACTNSAGPSSAGCSALFSNALSGGATGTQPTDTATAAINMAHNPSANIANLFALQSSTPPFQPDLSTAPNNLILTLGFSTGNPDFSPSAIAIDASGNVWVLDDYEAALCEFSPLGVALSGSSCFGSSSFADTDLSGPVALAIDSGGNIWTANNGGSSLAEFNSSGVLNPNSPFTGGGINSPTAIAIDGQGYIWALNPPSAGSLSKFNSSGVEQSGSSGYTGGGLDDPSGLVIDTSGDAWTANKLSSDPATISEFNPSGSPVSATGYSEGVGNFGPANLGIDGAGNIWVTNSLQSTLSKFGSGGTLLATSSAGAGGLENPGGIAIDGANNIWTLNDAYGEYSWLVEFNSSGTPISGSGGYYTATLTGGMAIDGSGNLWVSNVGYNNCCSESVSTYPLFEFIGVASPVVTPIVANLLSPYGQHAVNKP